jgi:hypothetical protein
MLLEERSVLPASHVTKRKIWRKSCRRNAEEIVDIDSYRNIIPGKISSTQVRIVDDSILVIASDKKKFPFAGGKFFKSCDHL